MILGSDARISRAGQVALGVVNGMSLNRCFTSLGTGQEPDPLTLPPSPIQELGVVGPHPVPLRCGSLPSPPEPGGSEKGEKSWVLGIPTLRHPENKLSLELARRSQPACSSAECISSVGGRKVTWDELWPGRWWAAASLSPPCSATLTGTSPPRPPRAPHLNRKPALMSSEASHSFTVG